MFRQVLGLFLVGASLMPWLAHGQNPVKETSAMGSRVLSTKYNEASRALDEAVNARDLPVIRTALRNRSFPLKIRAAKALAALKDVDSIPSLLETLKANQVVMLGGSETQILQTQCDSTVTSALEAITGMKFKTKSPASANEIDRVIQESAQWWRTKKEEH